MKKLQNDFTTLEQSKKLLELGVPANSANCCLRRIITDGGCCVTWRVDVFDFIGQINEDYFPCWSVGRLMEIYNLCAHGYFSLAMAPTNLIEHIISRYDWEIRIVGMDFSKLEE